VYEVFIKRGQSLRLCGFEKERHGRSVEIPTWMLEPAACCRLRMMAAPTVSCDALRALKAFLRTAARPTVDVRLQAQHRPVLAAGGADAPVTQSTSTLATDAVPSGPPASVASGVPARHPRKDRAMFTDILGFTSEFSPFGRREALDDHGQRGSACSTHRTDALSVVRRPPPGTRGPWSNSRNKSGVMRPR